MLELLITFAVILFAGFSVTLGVLLGKRTPAHSCHREPKAHRKETPSKCGLCQVIDARHETAPEIPTMAGSGFRQVMMERNDVKNTTR